jgi:transposase
MSEGPLFQLACVSIQQRDRLLEGETVREFYSALSGPILVGIEATGSTQWFLELTEALGIEYRVGHPQKIRKAETWKQKHDRRDARLLLTLLAEHLADAIQRHQDAAPRNRERG